MALTKVKLIADGVIVQSNLHASHGITTADIGENASYLYYTDARARSAVSVSGNALSYNSSTGVITSNFEESPTFTGNVVINGTTNSGRLFVEQSGADMIDMTRTSVGTYRLAISTSDKFSIYDVGAASDRLVIDSSGNVGIGTTLPTADLSVGSTSTSSGDVHLRTTKTTFSMTPSNTDAGGMFLDVGWVSGGQGPLKFGIGGTEKMRIDSSGNLLLTSNGDATQLQIKRASASQDNGLQLQDQNGNKHAIFNLEGSVTNNLQIASSAQILFHTSSDCGNPPTNEQMRITAQGRVGIGTTSPGTKLELYGNTSSGGFGDYPALTIRNDNASGYSAVHFNQSTTQKARIEVSNSAGSLGLYTTSGTNGILINSSGNVGIGTTSLTTYDKLQVIGHAWIGANATQGIRITNNGTNASIVGINQALAAYQGLELRASGTNGQLFLDTNGNVGIGETNPLADLHVRDSSQNSNITDTVPSWWNGLFERTYTTTSNAAIGIVGSIQALGAGGVIYLGYSDDVDNNWIGVLSSQAMTFGTNTVERMRIDSSGNVMMGKNSQSGNAALTVKSMAGGNTGLILIEGDTTNDGHGLYATTDNKFVITRFINGSYSDNFVMDSSGNVSIGTTNAVNSKLYVANAGVANLIIGYNNTSNNYFDADTQIFRNSSAVERMRITSGGEVVVADGINFGANAPTHRGSIILAGASAPTNFGGIEFHTNSGGGAGYGTKIYSSDATWGVATRNNSAAFTTRFEISGSTGNANFTGNLGVGTTSPIAQLDVAGNTNQHHSASTTNNGGWRNIQNLGVTGWLDQTYSAGRIKVFGYENSNVNVSYCEYYVIRSSAGYHIQQIGTRLDQGNTHGHVEVQISGNFLQVRNVAQSSLGAVRIVFSGMKD